jgi:hypothetical protein
MRKNKNKILLFLALTIPFQLKAVIPERAGWWKFDDIENPVKAEPGYGNDLSLKGTFTLSGGPQDGNGAIMIGPGSYYVMDHSISPNGGGKYVNEYSLQFDIKIPSVSDWHSFFQTSLLNNNDGDFFVNTAGNTGVGAVGYSSYSITGNEWYRIVVSIRNGNSFTCYLDGFPVLKGIAQPVDGRFSLDSLLLIFADENGEDGTIICAELAIWNLALTADQANELGGYGHDTGPFLMTRIPYLQSPGQKNMTICWHDTSALGTRVDFGLDSLLGVSVAGSSEIISAPYRWHPVKLSGLEPSTRYFYRVVSGNGVSALYSFKTLPGDGYNGKLRFILLSDTHATDTTMAGNVLRAARTKIGELYGTDIENHINGIFHSGDITVNGNSPGQYSTQYFQQLSSLSGNIPTMTVAGNHEGESPYFYGYLKLDDLSAYPLNPLLNEKIWQLRAGNSLFIGMNTNIIDQYGNLEANWLNTKLSETELDPEIDFVFLFFHHPPYSELWFDVSTFDGGANYVKNVLFPVIKKYTKVQQIHTGHTHGFERGTILSSMSNGDFRIICGGGGGGPLDSWGAFTNYDYNDIHIAIDNYCFQILEINIGDNSWVNSMYSLGDLHKSRNSEMMDSWYKKIDQPVPETPSVEGFEFSEDQVQFLTSRFSGLDSLMTVEIQVIDSSESAAIVLDSLIHWTNIYGVDNNYNPTDKNSGINLYQQDISTSLFSGNNTYFFRVRYRDHNLKWSNWSEAVLFKQVGVKNNSMLLNDYFLHQNYPNPFR